MFCNKLSNVQNYEIYCWFCRDEHKASDVELDDAENKPQRLCKTIGPITGQG
jgi:hypothetical protein